LAGRHLLLIGRQIMIGGIRSVEGTEFDFRAMAPMKRFVGSEQMFYEHNFCLSGERTAKRSVALARSLYSGVSLEVRST
ncbi:galactose-1-epimerase, partial [Rhizobium ruizarguesonis]